TGQPGRFHIDGSYRNTIIDYMPSSPGQLGWPRLTDMHGRVSLHETDLRMTAEQASVEPVPKAGISLRKLQARIANIEEGSVLLVQGESRAPASSYLALAHHSPLRDMLHGVLDPVQADGEWEVPLRLEIPLLDS